VTSLVRAEFLKLRTTRAWIGYTLALLVVSGLGAAAQVADAQNADLGTSEFSHELLMSALFADLTVFLIGIVSVTAEWRHGTITRTFLATPRRERVLVAKAVAALLVGAVLATLAILAVFAVAVPWISIEGSSFAVDGGLAARMGQLVLAVALVGALGVGFGAVIQSQTAAIVVGIIWVLLVENLIQVLLGLVDLEAIADFLPVRALGALEESVEDGLSPWAGGLVGLGWVLLIGVAGYVRTARRDVT